MATLNVVDPCAASVPLVALLKLRATDVLRATDALGAAGMASGRLCIGGAELPLLRLWGCLPVTLLLEVLPRPVGAELESERLLRSVLDISRLLFCEFVWWCSVAGRP